jgi:hypothetical protein
VNKGVHKCICDRGGDPHRPLQRIVVDLLLLCFKILCTACLHVDEYIIFYTHIYLALESIEYSCLSVCLSLPSTAAQRLL